MSDDTSSSLRLVVAPNVEPLMLAQAKTFLRIEHNADDEPITQAIAAARLAAEQYIRSALLTQTWDYSIANPPSSKLCLPFGPAQSIISITLTTEAGTTSTMNAENYRLSVDGFSVLFNPAVSIEKMTVQYVAGIASAAAEIPAVIIQGMLHHITVILENRDGDAPLPMQAIVCYAPFRRISL